MPRRRLEKRDLARLRLLRARLGPLRPRRLPARGAPGRFARGLAFAFAAGAWTLRSARDRAARAIGARPPWLAPAARAVFAVFPVRPGDPEVLVPVLLRDPGLVRAWRRSVPRPRIVRWYLPDVRMTPRWGVPDWPTTTHLAAALSLSTADLAWLADARAFTRRVGTPAALRHYRARWLAKPSGGHRLVESPKAHLKAVQRRILRFVLDRIPTHDAACGFVRGRSARDHASRHAGARFVLRMDLEDFFLTTRAPRVRGVFRAAGYPTAVAAALAALCLTVTPDDVRSTAPASRDLAVLAARARTAARLAQPHLAQGAPTSPALANLCALGLDRRLSALARTLGLTYSRYADDLAFSGDLRPGAARRVATRVAAIAMAEGYVVNHRKTREMPASTRQELTGIVVNAHPNVRRADYDRLKAILHACATRGPAGQDRAGHADFRAHLLGRVAWVTALDARRGAKLRALFDRIDWSGPGSGPSEDSPPPSG